ncbi:MAG: hypothetical protein CMH56_16765 [Myxococcales bacterium]|nr:hypothetical protein [Myxococcales bacterium]
MNLSVILGLNQGGPVLHPKKSFLLLLLLSAAVLSQASCRGGPCERVRADKLSFESRQGVASLTPGYQVEALVPLELLQDQMRKAFMQFREFSFQFNTLGQVGKFLGTFKLHPHQLALVNDNGQLMVATDFVVKDHQNNSLFNMGVQSAVMHAFEKDHVRFAVTPDAFRVMGVVIDEAAVGMLISHFRAQIPPTIAAFLPGYLVNEAAGLAIKEFKKIWARDIESKVAQAVAQHASVQVKLPPLPFSGFNLAAIGNALSLQLTTQAGTQHPLAPLSAVNLASDEIKVRMSGGLLAALGNQAIQEGLIPARYNTQGQADPEGSFVPGLSWTPSERPFQLMLWSEGDVCARVHLSALPQVAIVDSNAVVSIENDNIEEVWGPWWFEAGMHAFEVWQKTAEQSTDLALKVALAQNQLPLPLTPTNLTFGPGGLEASMVLAGQEKR